MPKATLRTLCSVFMLCMILPCSVSAESIFLKDGSIIEGKISSENDQDTVIRLPDNSTRNIKRKNILRIIFGDEYKTKVFFYTANGQIVEGYIVDSSPRGFVYRKDLVSREEFAMLEQDVFLIVHKQIAILRKIDISAAAKKEQAAAREDSTGNHAVFLKNGSIIEGTISETPRGVTVYDQNRNKHVIEKNDILRTVYTAGYKRKIYIYKMNGDITEAYIVNEERDFYTLREKLSSGDETVLKKSKVNFIARVKLEEPQAGIIQNKTNEKRVPPEKAVWDKWYITAGIGPAFPTGLFKKTLANGKNSGGQIHAAFQYFVLPSIDGSVHIFAGKSGGNYSEQKYKLGYTQVNSFGMAGLLLTAGYSFALIDNRLNLHVYGGSGYSVVSITYKDGNVIVNPGRKYTRVYGYVPICVGIELPVRLFNINDYCSFFTEYTWLPDFESNMGFINIGVRYAF